MKQMRNGRQVRVPEDIYAILETFKNEHGFDSYGHALFWILDNSQYKLPEVDPYDTGQRYNRDADRNTLKPLEEDPIEWHKARGDSAKDSWKQAQIRDLEQMIERIKNS
jgi:hypothetical protein